MTDVRLQRTIPAPPARVFRAWLDPALLTLTHTRLDDLAAAMPQVASQVSDGWSHALAQLPAALSS
jgi:hypothetical protein